MTAPISSTMAMVTSNSLIDAGTRLPSKASTPIANAMSVAAALAVAGGMGALGQFGVRRLWPFLAGFALLWVLMLASGVHATIAGVLTALTVPLGLREERSPLKRLEHRIHPWVMFGVVPLFGFSSAGVGLSGGLDSIAQSLPLAILAGLFIGKQMGIFGAIWLSEKLDIAQRPEGTSWRQIYGASLLCGIGFTMSLFIGALAFPGSEQLIDSAKLGILAGSMLSALAGYLVLRFTRSAVSNQHDLGECGELFGADQDR